LSAVLHLTAQWTGSDSLTRALGALPGQLEAAWQLDWRAMAEALTPVNNLFVLGRGLGLGLAQEAALKFKETSGLHAEAFSSAEVRHGPMALMKKKLPVLMFVQDDETRDGQEDLARELAAHGVPVLLAGRAIAGVRILPALSAPAAVAPLLFAQSFYRAVPALAVARGHDPDNPPHLKKVTETY
jgi:glutamine---fructose-6-phosphate transaminase (isomerizing)